MLLSFFACRPNPRDLSRDVTCSARPPATIRIIGGRISRTAPRLHPTFDITSSAPNDSSLSLASYILAILSHYPSILNLPKDVSTALRSHRIPPIVLTTHAPRNTGGHILRCSRDTSCLLIHRKVLRRPRTPTGLIARRVSPPLSRWSAAPSPPLPPHTQVISYARRYGNSPANMTADTPLLLEQSCCSCFSIASRSTGKTTSGYCFAEARQKPARTSGS